MRKVLLVILFACGFALPMFARAQTQAEIQQQIADLLQRLDELQKQLGSGETPVVTTGTPVSQNSSILAGGLTLARAIERGSRGEDVSALQQFLAYDAAVYPEGKVTGFYGPLTEAAVKRFQIACGIVTEGDYYATGFGRVGPRTLAALLSGCGTPSLKQLGNVLGGFMRVSPTSGPPPLSVTIAATVNTAASCEAASYTIDFGDGTIPTTITVPGGYCAELNQSVPHRYLQSGIYTIALRSGEHSATTRVTVGDGISSGQGAPYPSFTYQGRTYKLGSEQAVGTLWLYEYALAGEPIDHWSELFSFGRDTTLNGSATLTDLDGAAQQTVDMMKSKGAVIHKTFTYTPPGIGVMPYNVIIMAFPLSDSVELDIRKMFLKNGEIVSITYGKKVAITSSASAQQIMNNYFADMDANFRSFVDTEFYLPWLVTYFTPTNSTP